MFYFLQGWVDPEHNFHLLTQFIIDTYCTRMEERNMLEKLVDLNLHLIVTRVMLMLDPPSLHAAKQVDFHADCNALGLSTMYNVKT